MKIFKSPVLTLLVLLVAAAPARAAGYIDPQQQTSLAFGERSYWLQPWRGDLDTVPGTVMRDAVGVNLHGDATQSARTVQLLAASGVRRARVEFGWNRMSFDDPSRLADPARLEALLRSLRDHGIRPLLLLNAHEGAPGPTRLLDLRVVAPAAAGARTLRLDAASARTVVAGRTGLNALDGSYKAADVLFTRVAADGTVTLS